MENLFWIGFAGAAVALLFALMQRNRVMAFSEGNEKMRKIAASIRAGANAYLKHQYTTVFKVFLVVFIVLLVIAFGSGGDMLSQFTPFAFLTGGIWSMLAGFIGMKIATNSNARTAQAASESLNKGLRVAFSSGSVMGFTVVGLGMLDITLWFFVLRYAFGVNDPVDLGNIMVMNGMGASFMALFARVGGGIYTKAADVGADLVGKVEAGIPEDDPRNPATIADNVGDNVGDVAGMGADLYESYVGSILATFALGAVGGYGWGGLLLPVALAVVGILCSILGSFLVKTKEDASQESLLKSLRTGTYTAAILAAVLAAPLTYFILDGHMGVYVAILCGLIGGCAIGYFTEYYTSDTYKPTQELAAASETGSATIIIGGISLGLKSTLTSILIVAAAVLISYFAAGGTMEIVDEAGAFTSLRPRGGQRRRHRRDERPAGGGPGAHRRPGLPGQHHRRHRQGLRHRLRVPDRPGPAGELRQHRPGEHRGDPELHPHQPHGAGGHVHRRHADLRLLRLHHERGAEGGPIHRGGGPPAVQGDRRHHGVQGRSGLRLLRGPVHQGRPA